MDHGGALSVTILWQGGIHKADLELAASVMEPRWGTTKFREIREQLEQATLPRHSHIQRPHALGREYDPVEAELAQAGVRLAGHYNIPRNFTGDRPELVCFRSEDGQLIRCDPGLRSNPARPEERAAWLEARVSLMETWRVVP